ncbi:MAG: MFS transporter [Bacillota bacterium]|nr:MFS transporter [Bacillota bacterium]
MLRRFPGAVWATAFGVLIAFMGIGVVDPIMPLIGRAMGLSTAQVEWLFTSYIAVMSLAMLVSGVLATRWGARRVLLTGLLLVVVFATASGLAPGIGPLALFRGGWGLGNAFFTSTALSIITGAAGSAGIASAVTLYESAMGLGIASGPLLGGLLGRIRWQMPFFGTAALMAVALVLTLVLVRETGPKERPRSPSDIFGALRHPAVLTNALAGLAYSYVFFTILAYSPTTPALAGLGATGIGLAFFGWGILLGLSSVIVVNWLRPRLGPVRMLLLNQLALLAVVLAAALVPQATLVWVVVLSGIFCGIANALFTTLAMEVSPFSRSISSGTYNFVRWAGAALAPVLSGVLREAYGVQTPFWVAAAVLVAGVGVLFLRRGVLVEALALQGATEGGVDTAESLRGRELPGHRKADLGPGEPSEPSSAP